jgi:4-hydroxy-tetrahydrodipicolinate reductase
MSLKIALIGYGKMGKTIEQVAKDRGHSIAAIIDQDNPQDLETLTPEKVDVAIEFTEPVSAFRNISMCLLSGIPIVSGTTGWLERRPEIEKLCLEVKGAFFYASNYSIGVNLFFQLNRLLAQLMQPYPGYQVSLEEIHHTQKKDAPSGTAITLAEGILAKMPQLSGWKLDTEAPSAQELPITAIRRDAVPGTHTIRYDSPIDQIQITHTAHTRLGFAQGAVVAAEWIFGKSGNFTMEDLLGFAK